uniref:peptidylprolyl isomerase n=2 Tax=Meloidogyne incognita group TaxID=654580 RepID=A0A915LZ51_MELJA
MPQEIMEVVEQNQTIDLTADKDGGVLKTIIKQGIDLNKHPRKGDTVFIHYTGTIKETGKKFDDSRARDQPFCCSLGRGHIIKALDLCLITMCKGEVARLECLPKYAYGHSGTPPKIPGNATLIFEIELLSFEGEDLSPDRNALITKSILKEGKGKAIRRMNRGEKAIVTLRGHFAYGLEPPPYYQLDKMAEVNFTIFLKGYEKMRANWELNDEEKLERAQNFKDLGNEFLKAGKYNVALNKYSAIIYLMEHAKSMKSEEKGGKEMAENFQQMFFFGLLNSALASLKMGDTLEAIKFCDKVLEKNATNVKALYRKAQAYQQRQDYDEAINYFKKVLEIEPENKASAQQIIECNNQKLAVAEHQRKKFKGMFG